MSVLPVGMGSSGVDTGDIGHSLRFRSGASAYLSKTLSTPSNQAKWALSMWVKRGQLGVLQNLLGTGTVAGNMTALDFGASDRLQIYYPNTGANLNCLTNAVFRDPTSQIHIFVYFDSANGTTADRLQIWVNGVRQTFSTATYPSAACGFNGNVNHQFGRNPVTGSQSDDYKSRIAFVDNPSGVTASSFGYQNTEINEWVTKSQSAVKAVVDAGGTNSFMLDFDDGTSLTTLGYDKSSKGNNWTLNNFSLTAGTSYDWMLDVPGNSFATLNPLDIKGTMTLSSGNLVGTNGAAHTSAKGSIAVPEGVKTYAETVITSTTSASVGCGFGFVTSADDGFYNSAGYYGFYASNIGVVYSNVSILFSGLGTFAAGTVLQVASDGTGKYWVGKDNVWYDSAGGTTGNPSTGANPTFTLSGQLFVRAHVYNNTTSLLFGQAPLHASATYDSASGGYFRFTPPAGYKALCQRNLPDPAILNPSSFVAHRFEAGSGIASSIATDRSGWSDWMEWFKRTDTAESWKVRFSDDSSNMMAFDTNGAKAAWSAPSTGTYLGAAFKLGASSGCVSGTYSGDNTSNKNISHQLGKPPTGALVKNESTGSWYVWHAKMTSAAYFTTLNSATPPAQSNTNTPWGTGNWSSAQFMVTNNATNNLNATGSTYRYILFADIDGLLALLGHTGNASTDGAFEYAGHKAQLLIEKDLSATTGFYVWSDKIDTYNVTASYLLLNTNAGTAAATGMDICSNAVKYRSATIANAANPHMGISYSRTPGKYSLGR